MRPVTTEVCFPSEVLQLSLPFRVTYPSPSYPPPNQELQETLAMVRIHAHGK